MQVTNEYNGTVIDELQVGEVYTLLTEGRFNEGNMEYTIKGLIGSFSVDLFDDIVVYRNMVIDDIIGYEDF